MTSKDRHCLASLLSLIFFVPACGSDASLPQPDCSEVALEGGRAEEVGTTAGAEPTQKSDVGRLPQRVTPPVVDRKASDIPAERTLVADPVIDRGLEEISPPGEAHSEVSVVGRAVSTAVKGRVPFGVSEIFTTEAGTLWAWVKVKNRKAPTKVTMVWRKDGKLRSKITLDVGTSVGWRTWSRKSIGVKDVGAWTVDVFAQDGKRIDQMSFNVVTASVRAELGEMEKSGSTRPL